MQTILFHSTIFGPIHSRRLGVSLGVNLMPADGKVCTFDCLYCEAGYNAQGAGHAGLPSREDVRRQLHDVLQGMVSRGEHLDVITFSGNGEPTLHPDFAGIIDDTIALRDEFFPEVKISVLSNSTQLHRPDVCNALRRIDNNILKLDSAVESTMRTLDRPTMPSFTVDSVVDQLAGFAGNAEIHALIEAYRRIRPRELMIYTSDRPTPEGTMRRVSSERLREIGERITAATGIPVQVTT